MAGHRRAEATPSFGRLCPAMMKNQRPAEAVRNAKTALKASRKPIKLPMLAGRAPCRPFINNSDPTSTRPGYVIDDGPRNEAPGDADCGGARHGADRPDRNVLVAQPG